MEIFRTTAADSGSELDWRRSTNCANSGCVEVAVTDREIKMRSSNNPESGVISFRHHEWLSFITAVKAGKCEIDLGRSRHAHVRSPGPYDPSRAVPIEQPGGPSGSAGNRRGHSTVEDEMQVLDGLTDTWRTASRCTSSGCVEAKLEGEVILVRSSRDPNGVSVRYDRDEWKTFVSAVKAGEFDIA
jgi:uncharacterized protein DUF397